MTRQLAVLCSIDNCHYWAKGNECMASQILITSDEVGRQEPESFDAPVASNMERTPVNKCMETCCKTFMGRDTRNKHADDVAYRSDLRG